MTGRSARSGLSPVLLDEAAFADLVRSIEAKAASLEERLELLRTEVRASLSQNQRADLMAVIERLRMLQIVEQGLAVGDTLPDFVLVDAAADLVSSEALLSRGPLALVFVRGLWCPYCSLTLRALDDAMPAVERAGGSLVVVAPTSRLDLAQVRATRALRLTLLSDPEGRYAQLCGVRYEMSDAQAELYRGFGLDIDRLNAAGDWSLPVPAMYAVGRDGVVGFAFADPDWSRRAEPAAIVAAVERLAQATDTEG